MAATGTPTPNIGLRIPLGTDPASVDDINYNSNLIDTKLGAVGNDSVQDQIDDLNSKISNLNSELGTQDGYAPIAGSKYTLESGTIRIFGLWAFLSCHVIASTSASSSDILVTVPSNILPSSSALCVALFFKRGTGMNTYASYCTINTNGEVKQSAVSSVQQNDEFFAQILYKKI